MLDFTLISDGINKYIGLCNNTLDVYDLKCLNTANSIAVGIPIIINKKYRIKYPETVNSILNVYNSVEIYIGNDTIPRFFEAQISGDYLYFIIKLDKNIDILTDGNGECFIRIIFTKFLLKLEHNLCCDDIVCLPVITKFTILRNIYTDPDEIRQIFKDQFRTDPYDTGEKIYRLYDSLRNSIYTPL